MYVGSWFKSGPEDQNLFKISVIKFDKLSEQDILSNCIFLILQTYAIIFIINCDPVVEGMVTQTSNIGGEHNFDAQLSEIRFK